MNFVWDYLYPAMVWVTGHEFAAGVAAGAAGAWIGIKLARWVL